MTLTVGSLFSGIGGLDLGLERAGMNVIWQSEIDPYASKVLAKHWPKVPNYGDIKAINWGDVVRPDVICGGYPCQPFSTAGRRNGTNDPRHLWPWVRDAISELRPRYAIMENVRGHLTMGFDRVLADLASIGYDAQWQIVSAASVGAPHQRDRLIFVAYTQSDREWRGHSENTTTVSEWPKIQTEIGRSGGAMANDDSQRDGLNWSQRIAGQAHIFWGYNSRRKATDVSRTWWTTEPDVGRVADGIPNRVDRLKGLGNAVVPQVAELVGRMVMAHANA